MLLFALQDIMFFSQVVPVVLALTNSRFLPKPFLLFSYHLLLTLVSSILNAFLGSHRIHNLWVGNAFMPVHYSMLMYFLVLNLTGRLRQAALIAIPVFVLFWIVDFTLLEKIDAFSTYAKPVAYLVISITSALVLFECYGRPSVSLKASPIFWISSGALLYYSCTAALYAFSAMLLKASPQALRIAFSSLAVVGTITNIMYAVGIQCLRNPSISSGRQS